MNVKTVWTNHNTLPTAEILGGKNARGISGLWVLNEIIQKNILKI